MVKKTIINKLQICLFSTQATRIPELFILGTVKNFWTTLVNLQGV